jgi:hypothetical protein
MAAFQRADRFARIAQQGGDVVAGQQPDELVDGFGGIAPQGAAVLPLDAALEGADGDRRENPRGPSSATRRRGRAR